jgi:bifunctional non-homologous end joining protein LigD
MLALLASELPPNGREWAFEYKWDGVRAVYYQRPGRTRILARSENDITASYPELSALSAILKNRSMVLDGEIIALDDHHRPSFSRLQRRMHVQHPTKSLLADTPVFYVIFDVLFLDGKELIGQPYSIRRKRLEELDLSTPFSGIGPAHINRGKAMLKTAADRGLEGMVAKKMDSIYIPGFRSPNWLKFKVIQRQELVIGGWTPQEGAPGRVSSLLLGYYEGGNLNFAGRIGTGFTDEEHRRLAKKFKELETRNSPFHGPVSRVRGTTFLKPKLVAEVEYRRWPAGGLIQQGAYKGLRDDKDARHVVKEHPIDAV